MHKTSKITLRVRDTLLEQLREEARQRAFQSKRITLYTDIIREALEARYAKLPPIDGIPFHCIGNCDND